MALSIYFKGGLDESRIEDFWTHISGPESHELYLDEQRIGSRLIPGKKGSFGVDATTFDNPKNAKQIHNKDHPRIRDYLEKEYAEQEPDMAWLFKHRIHTSSGRRLLKFDVNIYKRIRAQ